MRVTAHEIDYNTLIGANTETHGNCPICKFCFDDTDIPAEHRASYTNPDHPRTSPFKYSKLIVIELSEIYDGGLVNQCPGCSFMWHRFTGVEVTDLSRVTKDGVY